MGPTQSRFCGVSSIVSITSRPGRDDCNWRSWYDWGKMSIFVVVEGDCWIVEEEEVVVWLELLDIGGVWIAVDVSLEGM